MRKTSISAGEDIRQILQRNEEVARITTRVFPIVGVDANLPYIAYRRTDVNGERLKSSPMADVCGMEVACYSLTYPQSIALAEAVRSALDQTREGGFCAINLTSSTEDYVGNAFVQYLNFEIIY